MCNGSLISPILAGLTFLKMWSQIILKMGFLKRVGTLLKVL